MTPEQQEIEEKQKDIDTLTDQLLDFELRFAERYIELRRFSALLQQNFGALYKRLDRWNTRIQASNQYLATLRDIKDQVRDIPKSPFDLEKNSIAFAEKELHDTDVLVTEVPARPSQKIIEIYHSLLKQSYPDICSDPEERNQRIALMSKINQAFVEQDIEKLQTYSQETSKATPPQNNLDLVQAVRRVARLRSLCNAAQQRYQEQEESPLGTLLQQIEKQAQEDEDPFSMITDMIEEQLDKKRFFWLNQQMRCAQLLTEVDP